MFYHFDAQLTSLIIRNASYALSRMTLVEEDLDKPIDDLTLSERDILRDWVIESVSSMNFDLFTIFI